MATQPDAVAVGDQITADYQNAMRDWVDGSSRTYTPTLTATTTNPTLGTGGSITGRYRRIGNQVFVDVRALFGSSGANAGSGTYLISLPVAEAMLVAGILGQGVVRAGGSSGWAQIMALSSGVTASLVQMKYTASQVGGALTTVTHSTPGAFTNNDEIRLTLVYEAAA